MKSGAEGNYFEIIEFFQSMYRRNGNQVDFMDPVFMEKIKPNRPPELLLQDERLKQGFDFLRDHGNKINLELILASHNPDNDEGLGDESFAYEKRVKECDIYLLEGVGCTFEYENSIQKLATTGKADDIIGDWIGNSLNTLRIAQAIQGTQKEVAFFDIDDSDDASKLRHHLLGVQDMFKDIDSYKGDATGKEKLKIIHIAAFDAIREWFIVGQLGYKISEACRKHSTLLNKLQDGSLKVLMTVGESHGDLLRKTKAFGILSKTSHPKDLSNQSIWYPRIMEQGCITDDFMSEIMR